MRFNDGLNNAPLGQVIASRAIEIAENEERLWVEIGAPKRFADDEAWYCPYHIAGPGCERTFAMVGIDSVQALLLTLNSIGSELFVIDRDLGGKLRLFGDKDLGFPMPTSIAP